MRINPVFWEYVRYPLFKCTYPKNSGKLFLQKLLIHQSCKTEFEDKSTNQLIFQNFTPHTYSVTQFWSYYPQWRADSQLATNENYAYYWHRRDWVMLLREKKKVTTPPSIDIEGVTQFQPLSQMARSETFALSARVIGACWVLHNIVWGSCSSSSLSIWTTSYHPNNDFLYSDSFINLLKPNDIYICRTLALTSRRYILNIYSTNIHTEYFKHAA